jgi:hypothetical protein
MKISINSASKFKRFIPVWPSSRHFPFLFNFRICFNSKSPYGLLSHQKCDPDDFCIIRIIRFPHQQSLGMLWKQFQKKKSFAGWHFWGGHKKKREKMIRRLTHHDRKRKRKKIKFSFININLASIIIYHFASPMSCSLCQSRGRNSWCKINISFIASSCLHAPMWSSVSVESWRKALGVMEEIWINSNVLITAEGSKLVYFMIWKHQHVWVLIRKVWDADELLSRALMEFW